MGDSLKENSVEVAHCRSSECCLQPSSRKQTRTKNTSIKDGRVQFPRGGKRYSDDSSRPQERYSSRGQRGGRGWQRPRDGVIAADKLLPSAGESLQPRRSEESRGKKPSPVSLNHLLNFTIAPRERQTSSSSAGASMATTRRRRGRAHSYNKEQFLQANCQFVVSASGDYSVHSHDPDLLVEWNKIEQVRLFCHQISSCPICLYPPRAAKITRCGHVYCWSCVLHYLSLGEKKWRKCPICYESIYKNDLKSVMALASQQYKAGDTITMKLMVREKGATEACAKAEWSAVKRGVMELAPDSPPGVQCVKLLSATPSQVLRLITASERSQLETQRSTLAEEEASELCFVESALEELKERELALKQAEVDCKEVDEIVKELAGSLAGGEVPSTEHAPEPSQNGSQASSSNSSSQKSKIWSSYADNYFEEDFKPGFYSDSEEEQEEESAEEPAPPSTVQPSPLTPAGVATAGPAPADALEPSGSRLSGDSSSLDSSPTRSLEHSESSPELSLRSGETVAASQSSASSSLVHFYQASDGQHLYLHPTNTKCLAKEYNGLENCPEEISANIVEMEQLSMSEEVGGRYRYLSHLPVTCQFVLCELELRPPLVSRDTLRAFGGELQKRRQKRQKKKREEKRRERKAEPTTSAPVIAVPQRMSPETFHDYLSLASSSQHPSSPPPHGDSQPGITTLDPSEGRSSAPSFAQALQGKPPPVWPVKSPTKPHRTGPLLPGSNGVGVQEEEEEGESEPSVVPLFQDAFNEALVSVSALAAQRSSGGKPGSKTAKKGRKKIVLFSTGGNRGSN